MKRFLMRILVVGSVMGLVGAGCLANPHNASAQAKPINVGVSMDTSGIGANEGFMEFPAFEMAVKEKNAAGGIDGRPIKLFVLDNGGDPTKTVGTLKVLKDIDKCPVMYYGIASVGALAAKAWAEQNENAVRCR